MAYGEVKQNLIIRKAKIVRPSLFTNASGGGGKGQYSYAQLFSGLL